MFVFRLDVGPGKWVCRFLSIGRTESDSVSTGVWCVLRFGAGYEIALKPSKLRK